MNKIVIIILLILAKTTYSQEVEKSIYGFQLGILGLEAYNETKIGKKLALRSEFNLNAGFRFLNNFSENYFSISPGLSIQTKYYYNLDKRFEKGRNTKYNSANYLAMQVKYISDVFVITNVKNKSDFNVVYLAPTFGIRRNFATKFNYEFKIGYGYAIDLDKPKNSTFGLCDLGFKIGYDF